MEDFLVEMRKRLPCRESQLTQLYRLIGEADEPLPPSIYVFGNSAAGKSASINASIKYLNYKHVILNAVECYSQKIMYETILNTLSGHVCNRENKYSPLHRCDNMKDFVHHLNKILPNSGYEPVFIVIDKAERLRDMDQNILPAFLKIREFCNLNICTILISDIVFEKYYLKSGLREPFKIYFPQYTKEELYKIIFLSQQNCVNFVLCQSAAELDIRESIQRVDLFANYLNAFLSVFYRPCRDLVELRHMAHINFVKYCEPILDRSVKADDVTKLWRHIAPALKSNIEMLYLRVQPSKNYDINVSEDPLSKDIELRMERLGITKQDVAVIRNDNVADELNSARTLAQSFELPFYAKFLLIAAYLASYNPVKEDKRLFMKYHGKQKKRMQQVNSKAKLSDK